MSRRLSLVLALVAALLSIAAVYARSVGRTAGPTEIRFIFTDSDMHSFTAGERREIEEIGGAAVREIAEALPDLPERIDVAVTADSMVIPETGEGGVALAPGRIGWTVDPRRPGGVAGVARQRLRVTLFHEAHHLVRGWTVEGGTVGNRIIDAAVSEGMATAFERDAAGSNPLWGQYPADEVAGWVTELEAAGSFAEYSKWMFQHPDGRRWIGYRAGTYLTDRAMMACGCSAADLVSTPTDEILALAR